MHGIRSDRTSSKREERRQTKFVAAVLAQPDVEADLPLHDDACHFEKYVKGHKLAEFRGIKF